MEPLVGFREKALPVPTIGPIVRRPGVSPAVETFFNPLTFKRMEQFFHSRRVFRRRIPIEAQPRKLAQIDRLLKIIPDAAITDIIIIITKIP